MFRSTRQVFIIQICNIRNEKLIQIFYQTLKVQNIHSWLIGLVQILNYYIQLKPNLKSIHNTNMQTFNYLLPKKNQN